MTAGTRRGRARRLAPGLAALVVAWGVSGPPHAAGRLAQAGGPRQGETAATRGEDGAAGRRDPFLPVPEPTAEPRRAAERPRGLAGLRVGEVRVVGIVTTGDARLAVLEAPDGRTYVTQANDRLADGLVREVAHDSVLFLLAPPDGRAAAGAGREMRRPLGYRPGGP